MNATLLGTYDKRSRKNLSEHFHHRFMGIIEISSAGRVNRQHAERIRSGCDSSRDVGLIPATGPCPSRVLLLIRVCNEPGAGMPVRKPLKDLLSSATLCFHEWKRLIYNSPNTVDWLKDSFSVKALDPINNHTNAVICPEDHGSCLQHI